MPLSYVLHLYYYSFSLSYSYHLISSHIISYHIISYHLISSHILLSSKDSHLSRSQLMCHYSHILHLTLICLTHFHVSLLTRSISLQTCLASRSVPLINGGTYSSVMPSFIEIPPIYLFIMGGPILLPKLKRHMKTSSQTSRKTPAIIITGTQYLERIQCESFEDNRFLNDNMVQHEYAFGYKDLTITVNQITTRLSKDDDKFIAYGSSIEEARTEFWARWSQFVKRAYGRTFVTILNN